MGTMSSKGKERVESEPEEQVESLGEYEDDNVFLLVAFIPDDAQRREVWRRQKLFEDSKICFAIPQTCKMTERIGRRPAMSL